MIANQHNAMVRSLQTQKESVNALGANVENFLQWKFAMEYEIFGSNIVSCSNFLQIKKYSDHVKTIKLISEDLSFEVQ